MEISLFILWLICGIGAAAVARSKGRSGCWWIFIGILIGPIALLIVGFMASVQAPPALHHGTGYATPVATAMSPPVSAATSRMDDRLKLLTELKHMLDASLITQEEYDLKKMEILKRM